MRFTLSPLVIAIVSSATVLLVVLAHLVFSIKYHILGYDFFGATMLYVLFDLHGEIAIPAWCSSFLLLVLSIDEAADLHGSVSYKLQAVFSTGGFLEFTWVIPGVGPTVISGLVYEKLASRYHPVLTISPSRV